MAKRLSGFGVEVIFYDILPNLEDEFAKQVSLEELQERADILSLHIPLDASTEYLVDENFISKMKKNFYLVNTARGKNVKTSALVDALKSGKVKARSVRRFRIRKIFLRKPKILRLRSAQETKKICNFFWNQIKSLLHRTLQVGRIKARKNWRNLS